jgi:4-hydroxybenzoate polyprenyltransferase
VAILPYLRLVRAGALLSPAADVVASLCVLGAPWSLEAVRAVLASVAVYAAGMVWNDFADRRRDAVVRPERPLPSGAIRPWVAAVLGTVLLAIGVVLAPNPAFHGLLAGLVLLYDFVSKRVLALGALNMGALRALNLWSVAPWFGGAEPVRQNLLLAALCYAVYVLAVTILGAFEDDRTVRPRAVANIQAAPLFAGLCGLWAVQGGLWPAPALAALPIAWFARTNARIRVWDQAAIRRSMTRLLLGTLLFSALLCAAADRWLEAVAILLAIAPARAIAKRISLT